MTFPQSNLLQFQKEELINIKKVDYVEFYVSNARQAAYFYQTAFGFTPVAYAGLETGVRDRQSYLLQKGEIRFVFTSSLNPNNFIAEYVKLHGDGVYDIAFLVDDVYATFQTAVNRGAKTILEPTFVSTLNGYIIKATLSSYQGDLTHSLIERNNYTGFAPQYHPISLPGLVPSTGLIEIDHIVINTELGNLKKWANFYQTVFGLYSCQQFTKEDISTEYSSLTSIVLKSSDGRIKFPINEPAEGRRKSQIQEYLDFHYGSGVQHIALRTNNIVHTIQQLRFNGIEFLEVPDGYYDKISPKLKQFGLDIEVLKELRILFDQHQQGYLLQIFTKPLAARPTFFIEIIERQGSQGFGNGNFKALFETIELEQAARGNL